MLALRRSWPLWTGAIGQGTRWTRRRLRFLAAAVHIVKLVSVVPVPAFAAITESRLMEEEARHWQEEHDRRRAKVEKPLTEKVKEVVGVRQETHD